MSEQNKDVCHLNFLQQFKDQKIKLSKTNQQGQELCPSLGLSLGGSYIRPSSGFIVRKFSLKDKSYGIRYGCGDSSGRLVPARAVPLHPDVEAELNKSKETKAMNRHEAKKRYMLKKRAMEGERQLEKEEGQRTKIGKFEGKLGNCIVGSTPKDTAYFHAMEKPKYTHALDQSSNAAWTGPANAYRPEPNPRVFEVGTSTQNTYANTYGSRNPYQMPMMRGRENVPDSAKTSRNMSQRPSVSAMGPDGKKIEGFMFNFGTSQVTIVCLCHYHWLTPAEFVRHAGLADVANPMQHIMVLATSL